MPKARAPSMLGRLSSISTASPGRKPPVAADEIVDRGVGLAAADLARDHVVAETAEKGMPPMGRSAQPGVEEAGRVGQQIERRSGLMQALDQLRPSAGRHGRAFRRTGRRRLRSGPLCRDARSPGDGSRRRDRPRGPARSCHCRGRHGGQEALHFLGIGDQLAIEVAGVPVEQHAAHVEDRDRGRRMGLIPGLFRRAIFGAFSAE